MLQQPNVVTPQIRQLLDCGVGQWVTSDPPGLQQVDHGHIIGKVLGGLNGDPINMYPQHETANERGRWHSFELLVAQLRDGCSAVGAAARPLVWVHIEFDYQDRPVAPAAFSYVPAKAVYRVAADANCPQVPGLAVALIQVSTASFITATTTFNAVCNDQNSATTYQQQLQQAANPALILQPVWNCRYYSTLTTNDADVAAIQVLRTHRHMHLQSVVTVDVKFKDITPTAPAGQPRTCLLPSLAFDSTMFFHDEILFEQLFSSLQRTAPVGG